LPPRRQATPSCPTLLLATSFKSKQARSTPNSTPSGSSVRPRAVGPHLRESAPLKGPLKFKGGQFWHQPVSIIHILSGCQHKTIRCQVTERHNIAGRLIYDALSKGALGAGVVFIDVGSNSRMEQQGVAAPPPPVVRTCEQLNTPDIHMAVPEPYGHMGPA